MSYGRNLDLVTGVLSRLLHLRGAKHNTVGDLEPYLGLSAEALFPAPERSAAFTHRESIVDRLRGMTTIRWRSLHEVICPRYRRRHETTYQRNLDAWARWLRPDGARRRDCIVYVHGWLEPGSWVEELTLFRKWTRELGVDMVHVALPFHGVRTPRGALFSGEFFWTADLVRSVEAVRQAVCDVRTIIDWLRTQGYERVGVSGLSLGGAITMLLACLRPTPDFVVPIIAHLELADAVEEAPILWRMKRDLESWGVDAAQRRRLFDRLGLSSYRPHLTPDRQLWVQARDDVYIRAALVRRQWEDWSRPGLLWVDGGHMTFALHIDEITDAVGRFLRDLD